MQNCYIILFINHCTHLVLGYMVMMWYSTCTVLVWQWRPTSNTAIEHALPVVSMTNRHWIIQKPKKAFLPRRMAKQFCPQLTLLLHLAVLALLHSSAALATQLLIKHLCSIKPRLKSLTWKPIIISHPHCSSTNLGIGLSSYYPTKHSSMVHPTIYTQG